MVVNAPLQNAHPAKSLLNRKGLQVFGDENLVVIQQRATTPLGQQVAFAESIASWIRGAKFKQVVHVIKSQSPGIVDNECLPHNAVLPTPIQVLLLGSIDAELRRGAQLEGSQLRYVCHSLSSALARTCQELGYIVLEVRCYSACAFACFHRVPQYPDNEQLVDRKDSRVRMPTKICCCRRGQCGGA